MTVDSTGNYIYVADSGNYRVQVFVNDVNIVPPVIIKITPINPEECRRAKEEDRMEDRRLLASGEMTAAQLQERNSFFKGPVRVLDKSASYR